jgi:hypothetical protein
MYAMLCGDDAVRQKTAMIIPNDCYTHSQLPAMNLNYADKKIKKKLCP